MYEDPYFKGIEKKALANLIAGLVIFGVIALIMWLTGQF